MPWVESFEEGRVLAYCASGTRSTIDRERFKRRFDANEAHITQDVERLADGLLSARTDMNGATTTFEYDAGRRLTRRCHIGPFLL